MKSVIKQWDDGGSLTATYEGSGDGSAVFSSDEYEGIDRTMPVFFKGGGLSVERIVRQEGIRERFVTSDGKVFCILDGGRFGVLKEGFEPDEPPTPMETYTRLTYIESTGKQFINLDYIVKEDDIIEIRYIPIALESGRLFGTIDSAGNSIYFSFSAKNAYARFGSNKATTITNCIQSNCAVIKKGSVVVNALSGTLAFNDMPTTPLCLFACLDSNDEVTAYSKFRCVEFTIKKANGETMDLFPYKRNSDGKVGMLDAMSGVFYVNQGEQEDFIEGASYTLPQDYSLIDGVTFNADKLFDICKITQDDSIDIMYQRSDISTSIYLYGIVNSDNTASVTAYLAATGAWRFGNQLVRPNTANKNVHTTRVANANASHDCSPMTMSKSVDFITEDTVVLGGYRGADGVVYPQYKGKVYYIRVNDGQLIDWISCKRLSDGLEGFWDCITQTFVEPL